MYPGIDDLLSTKLMLLCKMIEEPRLNNSSNNFVISNNDDVKEEE